MKDPGLVHNLLARLKHGDIQAAAELYTHCAESLYNYGTRIYGLSHHDAEDVVNTTFVRVIDKIYTYNEWTETGDRWMYTICRNIIIGRFRKELPQVSVERIAPPQYPSLEDRTVEQERIEAFQRAWEKLTEIERREIIRGRGRGPGRAAWHKAFQRLREAVYSEEHPDGK